MGSFGGQEFADVQFKLIGLLLGQSFSGFIRRAVLETNRFLSRVRQFDSAWGHHRNIGVWLPSITHRGDVNLGA